MREHLLALLLGLCLKEAERDRDNVNARQFPVEEKRAVAHVYTKLKEAQMWMGQAEGYYRDR
jgi:hypothetical protein